MTDRIEKFGLQVARPLHDMIEREALPAAGVASDTFWQGLSGLVHDLGPNGAAFSTGLTCWFVTGAGMVASPPSAVVSAE